MTNTTVMIIAVVIAVAVAVAVWFVYRQQRSKKLRSQFGPEYDDAVTRYGSSPKAEEALLARQRRIEKLHIRSLPPEERDETATFMMFDSVPIADLDHPLQLLLRGVADWNDYAANVSQLLQQRFGYRWRGGGHQDRVVRREFRPSQRAVANQLSHIDIAKALQALASRLRQVGTKFDAEDFSRQLRKYGGLISAASANLQNFFVTL